MRRWSPFLGAAALGLFVVSSTFAVELPKSSGLDPAVEEFFAAPWKTFTRQKTPPGFRIIVLSNLAEYCTNQLVLREVDAATAERCVSTATELALSAQVSPYHGDTRLSRAKLGDHGLYLSHLNIILGARARVLGNDEHRALNQRITSYLVDRTKESPTHHVPSYAKEQYRWPADQTATLYSLYLYDQNYGTSLSEEPIRLWLETMKERGTNPKWGLPVSEITGKAKHAEVPRGCALSWSVRYMAAYAPVEARAIWTTYKERYGVTFFGIAGLREWPPGMDVPGDVDSGPIVLGIGASATGLGLGASRAMGDTKMLVQLQSLEAAVRTVAGKSLRDVGDSILAKAIELNGLSTTRWFAGK